MDSEVSQPPATFLEIVRDALAHLYEPTRLANHPLAEALADSLPRLADRGQSLRLYILDAIERLEPVGSTRLPEKTRRPYLVMVQRYIGGYPVEQIIEALHIGERQFRREHQKGLEMLSAYLWEQCNQYRNLITPTEITLPTNILSEVETIGVEMQRFALDELIAAAYEPALALAKHYNVSLKTPATIETFYCLGDRMLARQALLSCLHAMLAVHPQILQINTGLWQRSPYIELTAIPFLQETSLRQLQQEILSPQALIAAQGGNIHLHENINQQYTSLRLTFRTDNSGYILVIDDNEKMLRLYERYLMVGKYNCETATSAREAEYSLSKRIPDAIILDIMMRDTDGWELLQKLRAQPELALVPIIVCSILNEPAMAMALGAQSYLRKPITAEALLSALSQVFDENNQAAPHLKENE